MLGESTGTVYSGNSENPRGPGDSDNSEKPENIWGPENSEASETRTGEAPSHRAVVNLRVATLKA